jgi:hypothetical protein
VNSISTSTSTSTLEQWRKKRNRGMFGEMERGGFRNGKKE